MKFLITGASGFVGKNLSEKLLELYGNGNEFIFIAGRRKLDFLEKHKIGKRITVVHCDITDHERMGKYFRGVDHVFHLAAKLDYGDPRRSRYYDVNVAGAENIFKLALQHKIRK